jgi:hypothetical protein
MIKCGFDWLDNDGRWIINVDSWQIYSHGICNFENGETQSFTFKKEDFTNIVDSLCEILDESGMKYEVTRLEMGKDIMPVTVFEIHELSHYIKVADVLRLTMLRKMQPSTTPG